MPQCTEQPPTKRVSGAWHPLLSAAQSPEQQPVLSPRPPPPAPAPAWEILPRYSHQRSRLSRSRVTATRPRAAPRLREPEAGTRPTGEEGKTSQLASRRAQRLPSKWLPQKSHKVPPPRLPRLHTDPRTLAPGESKKERANTEVSAPKWERTGDGQPGTEARVSKTRAGGGLALRQHTRTPAPGNTRARSRGEALGGGRPSLRARAAGQRNVGADSLAPRAQGGQRRQPGGGPFASRGTPAPPAGRVSGPSIFSREGCSLPWLEHRRRSPRLGCARQMVPRVAAGAAFKDTRLRVFTLIRSGNEPVITGGGRPPGTTRAGRAEEREEPEAAPGKGGAGVGKREPAPIPGSACNRPWDLRRALSASVLPPAKWS